MTTGAVRALLRLEGGAVFALSAFAYLELGGNFWLFVPLVMLVDVSMLGYLANARIGALGYNAFHNWIPAAVLVGLGLALRADLITLAGLVVAAHVGVDRLLGYGLKYATSFADTHLGRIGKRIPSS